MCDQNSALKMGTNFSAHFSERKAEKSAKNGERKPKKRAHGRSADTPATLEVQSRLRGSGNSGVCLSSHSPVNPSEFSVPLHSI